MEPNTKKLYMEEVNDLCNTYGYQKNDILIDVPYDLETINKLNIKYGNKNVKFVKINNNYNNQKHDIQYTSIIYYAIIMTIITGILCSYNLFTKLIKQ